MRLSVTDIKAFSEHLNQEEKRAATREKYLRDVQNFCRYAGKSEFIKELVMGWKKQLVDGGYAVRSVNAMLTSVNGLFGFLDLSNCRVKNIRMQQQSCGTEDKKLIKVEHMQLLGTSQKRATKPSDPDYLWYWNPGF